MKPLQDASFESLAPLARLVGQAFLSSPTYSYIFKDSSEQEKLEGLVWLLHRNIWLHAPSGCCYMFLKQDLKSLPEATPRQKAALSGAQEFDDDAPVCFFMVIDRSTRPPLTTWEKISAGLLLMPFKFGFGSLMRMMEATSSSAPTSGVHAPGLVVEGGVNRMFYLHNMVVHPRFQGLGLGSLALGHVLEQLKANMSHAHVERSMLTLNTQEERNTTFYKRLGLEIVDEGDVFDQNGVVVYHNYVMSMRLT